MSDSDTRIRVLLVIGSVERPSYTHTNLEIIACLLREHGVCTDLWDLYEDPLPIFAPTCYDPHTNESEAVRRLARLADKADAFVWGSPVYHNSFSGVLKNALDSLTTEQFRHKPVALMSNGNSERTGVQPCDQLRIVARGLLAVAIPIQVVTIASDFKLSQGHYILINEDIHERFIRMVDELITYAVLMRQLHCGGSARHAETSWQISQNAAETPGSAHVSPLPSSVGHPNSSKR
jgi:azobenzene reductase